MRSNFAVPWRTPSRGQGWRCCRGPRTHVWRRHVDCVGRICVQVPRPTDDAQMRADSTSSAEREQSRPAGATARSHGSTAVESPVELPPSPQGSFLTLAFDAPHCERPELDTIGTILFPPNTSRRVVVERDPPTSRILAPARMHFQRYRSGR
jgi:hypothetical protein